MSSGVANQLHVRVRNTRRGRGRHGASKRGTKRVLCPRAPVRVRALRSERVRDDRKDPDVSWDGRSGVCVPQGGAPIAEARGVPTDVLRDRDPTVLQELSGDSEQTGGRSALPESGVDGPGPSSDEDDAREFEIPEMRRMIEVDELSYAVSDLERCRDFVRRMKGCRFRVSWPRDYVLTVRSEADLGLPMGELSRLSCEYLCCPEELVAIGSVAHASCERDSSDPIVLAGECSRIYLYVTETEDALYLLGDNVAGFVKRGLKRFYSIYKEVGPGDYGKDFIQRVIPDSPVSIAEFCLASPGMLFPLPWPMGAVIKTVGPRKRRFARHGGSSTMVYFATVVGKHLAPIYREILLAVDERGGIFSYNPWEDAVTRICDSIVELFAVGLRPVKKTYRFRTRLPPIFGDKPPQCPHVGAVILPRGLCGNDSTVRCLCRIFDILVGKSGRGRNT
uniref:Protein m25.1 n=1 Tax=Mastomys natalensis cytomegalovirus 2 TaxID=2973540 RepID=A0A9Y1N7T2_9BETA|nr:protein m25.1 [Mastomys natalensis cytomegalovirus 2]WEG69166.1 protein m25.1 [Mastomys natalensis cytomegalovirus 2]WEG69305.1 protein m25.1 [Mastomys natalensis cytomegalovirus 2]WEG69443.1 protein m25.1 [Mastomys natalensis cytomegalovirus 2]WEG69581.1 protein m25.1 [Mastomys natalensis cytomegalovirus 2]